MLRISTLCLLVLSLSACGGSGGVTPSEVGHLSGTVTIDGKPAPAGVVINFTDGGNAFTATVTDGGKYDVVQMLPSAPAGKYKVSLLDPPLPTKEVDGLTINDPDAKEVKVVPKKFQDSQATTLTLDLTEGEQTYDITIP